MLDGIKQSLSNYVLPTIKSAGRVAYAVCLKQPEDRTLRYAANTARGIYLAHLLIGLYTTAKLVKKEACQIRLVAPKDQRHFDLDKIVTTLTIGIVASVIPGGIMHLTNRV